MCGIAAIFATSAADSPADRAELLRMRERMTARGPDGAGLWVSENGRIGLAHRRLAIIELSEAGAQPMVSVCGKLRIVFNGEIYNHRTLRAELEQHGVRFRSHSDTEVILEMYRRWGVDMLDRLRGMFAFVLWDEDKQGILIARDHFGIKPVYVADDGKTVRIASQVKALLAGGAIDRRPDPAGHAGFFLWGHVPDPHTLYQAIKPLPAGTWLWVGNDGARRAGRYFNMTEELAAVEPASAPIDGTTMRKALLDSVQAHLEADVPVGVFLSSGLDSTVLAGLSAECALEPIRTVTLGFKEFAGTDRDEAPLAETAASLYGARHQTKWITAEDFAAARSRIAADMDQPSLDGVNTWFVARAAAEAGLKVALSGLGGDELFGGYDNFRTIPALRRRLRAFSRMPWAGRLLRRLSAPAAAALGKPKAAGMFELGGELPGGYLLRRGLYMPWDLPRVMDPDMAAAGLTALAPLHELEQSVRNLPNDRCAVGVLETGFYMRNQLLRDSDWAGMAHSLEIRTPLVDVSLFRAMAPHLAGTAPPSKQDMAASPIPALPDAVLHRPKTGFFVPVSQWLGVKNLKSWARIVYDAHIKADAA